MKTAVWKRIVTPVLPEREEWGFSSHLCYRAPVDRIVWGVYAGSSSFDKSATLRRVMMPLVVPGDGLVAAYGSDIDSDTGRRRFFEEDVADIQAAVAPVLREHESDEQAFRRVVARSLEIPRNWLLAEPAGYALVLLGEDATDAKAFLSQVVEGAATTEWPNETSAKAAQRAALITDLLDNGEREQAVSQLDSWCEYTAHALGLRYDHR